MSRTPQPPLYRTLYSFHIGCAVAHATIAPRPLPHPGKGGARMRADRVAAIHAPATAPGGCMGPREPPVPRCRTTTSQAPADYPSPPAQPPLPSPPLRPQGQWSREHPFRPFQQRRGVRDRGGTLSLDAAHHVLPRSEGGRDVDANLVLLCGGCHRGRHG